MQWCEGFGQVLWASLMIPISLPLLILLFIVAAICGLTGEFLLWLFPTHIFSKELVEMGNNLASTAKKIFYWSMLKNSAVGLLNKNKHVRNYASAALQSMKAMVEHVINMPQQQQPVPVASHLPFTVPRKTIIYGFPKIGFTYQELAAATDGFAASNFIGEGGYGKVYKGKLQDGRHVAIKTMMHHGAEMEFFIELDFLSRVHHRHLVQLIGCCVSEGKSLLVYEYFPKGSLDTYLHGDGSKTIDWPTRMKVALGSVKALAYLHEGCQPRIIHRDIKPANILLDDHFQPKVADFGLGKFLPDDETHIELSCVAGTFGYICPEYFRTRNLNEKSDVYSYGVMLLELISGRRGEYSWRGDPTHLVDRKKWKSRLALQNNDFSDDLLDPRLMNQYNHDEVRMMIACGIACTRYSPHDRPPIRRIALVLGGKLSPEILGSMDPNIYSQNIIDELNNYCTEMYSDI